MRKDFIQGQKLKAIYLGSDGVIEIGVAGPRKVAQIEVVLENGQMAGVPWFLVTYNDGSQTKWNAALVEGVAMLAPEPKEPPNDQ